ncbi:phosphoadenylylsulfate reductase (thioredoxin) [Jannaschia faecimaris]|uniref:Adenosine 5'-phosphosulfate reductase n=1 Tax=Jannaschia faecimaris TaxID=1244108 RepID=A0A1H3RPF7_9RHOB|nr:phosphoadenylyl-sulfate reductase [Jannaschia faecimaris]SDZ26789.1 phosphoadenylylsulfate reductase (thioredoxin) [Jannaschia faecimaris]
MPLDLTALLTARAAKLNADLADADALSLLDTALRNANVGDLAMVSSFGAESVVLLHLLSRVGPDTPILFLETGMLFPETLAYQQEVAGQLGLTDVRVIRPDTADLFLHDPEGDLHQRDADTCCALRKSKPLELALQEFDGSITGRKRHQTGDRATMELFEVDAGRLRINPLAGWTAQDIAAYMDAHDLPRHPLVAQGFASVGCAPCTTKVAPGEDPRAGRWRGRVKTECGIHFSGGRIWPGQGKGV